MKKLQRTVDRVRDRLDNLADARHFRRSRTLYWRSRSRATNDLDKKAIYLRRARASAELGQEIEHTESVLRKRERNALRKLKHLKKLEEQKQDAADGLLTIDGKQVARGVGAELLRIREGGRWKGYIVSGFRTPEYSESLCYSMCGAPSCPGRCAGRNTNHARKPPEWDERAGAVDLTDFYTFAAECRRLGSWLENHLPQDLVHFSDSGN